MFYVGLLITAADVLIALALANFGAKSAAKTQALEQSGVLALAQIIGMGETGTRINEQPLVKLRPADRGTGHRAVRRPGPRHRAASRGWAISPTASWWRSSIRPPRSTKSIGNVAL